MLSACHEINIRTKAAAAIASACVRGKSGIIERDILLPPGSRRRCMPVWHMGLLVNPTCIYQGRLSIFRSKQYERESARAYINIPAHKIMLFFRFASFLFSFWFVLHAISDKRLPFSLRCCATVSLSSAFFFGCVCVCNAFDRRWLCIASRACGSRNCKDYI